MNTLRDHLGRVVTIDEDRDMTLRFLKHRCPDGEYYVEGPGIDMKYYRINGIVYPSGGTIDGQGMPIRSRAECIEVFHEMDGVDSHDPEDDLLRTYPSRR